MAYNTSSSGKNTTSPATPASASASTPITTRLNPANPTPIFPVSPGLYISHFPIKLDPRITHVLNLGKRPNDPDETRRYLHIPQPLYQDLSAHLRDILIVVFILGAYDQNGAVLVHGFGDINVATEVMLEFMRYIREGTALRDLWRGWGEWEGYGYDDDDKDDDEQLPRYLYDNGIGPYIVNETPALKKERLSLKHII